jgi:prepilin-type N-terminal cleavage/methylation domain-containing protein
VRRRGFTIVELLVAAALFTTLLSLVWTTFSQTMRGSQRGFLRLGAVQAAVGMRTVLDRDVVDGKLAAPPVVGPDGVELAVRRADGAIDRVAYSVDGAGHLQRRHGAGRPSRIGLNFLGTLTARGPRSSSLVLSLAPASGARLSLSAGHGVSNRLGGIFRPVLATDGTIAGH